MTKSKDKIKSASPKVRKFARELGANIIQIPGTQRAGRVSEEDVKNFIKSQITVNKGSIEKKEYKEEFAHEEFGEIELKEIPRIKKLSGPQLVRSWAEIPHVTQHDEIDITEMEQFRSSLYDFIRMMCFFSSSSKMCGLLSRLSKESRSLNLPKIVSESSKPCVNTEAKILSNSFI